ncbi:MAG TPA: hypothetical protein VGG02_00430 [Chthoniobacterales bacterium]|jgi:hypothetical protein
MTTRAATFLSLLLFACAGREAFGQGFTGIFGGGPFYINAANNITEIENSGFTEAIVWSVEVKSNGDLNFNGEFPLTSNGAYIGDQTHPDFASNMAQLKQGTVKRVTFSIGSSNVGDWQDITSLVQSQGTGPGSILYKDFAALKAAIPALDAIDFDDENSFDSPTTIAFAVMLGNLGYHCNPDAFDNNSYWENVVSQTNAQLPGTIDGVHLQCYAGGSGNSPCNGWDFGAVPVWPGLWDADDSPTEVQNILTNWNTQCGINGGFMWLYDDFVGNGLAAQYANAINTAVSGVGFTLSGPSTVFLDENGSAQAVITITPKNGFKGQIDLTASNLPFGVTATFAGNGTKRRLSLTAGAQTATGFYTANVTGTSGAIHTSFSFTLAISAAKGTTGSGTPADLSSVFNLNGIYKDGATYSGGGLDGQGYSYSANLLGASRVLVNVLYDFGRANKPDAIACGGQVVTLPAGQFSRLILLGTAIEGNQSGQVFTINYTDGTSAQFKQNLSDWFTPQNYPHETEAVAMPYRDFDDGTKDLRTFNLYAYRFTLTSTKTVQSITLPANPDDIVLAATLVP